MMKSAGFSCWNVRALPGMSNFLERVPLIHEFWGVMAVLRLMPVVSRRASCFFAPCFSRRKTRAFKFRHGTTIRMPDAIITQRDFASQ